MTKLCQTLILRKGRVLLGTWKKGPFAGRVTGLLGKASCDDETPEMVSERKSLELANVTVHPQLVSRRAMFAFVEEDTEHPSAKACGEAYVETQLVYDADLVESIGGPLLGKPEETDEFVPKWYALNKLPFKNMPEDDEWWYPRVLGINEDEDDNNEQERLFGEFVFIGSELQSHEVKSVTATSGDLLNDATLSGQIKKPLESDLVREISRQVSNLGDDKEEDNHAVAVTADEHDDDEEDCGEKDVPVILHNSNCSKSRKLIKMIENNGIEHRIRDYVKSPLSLSELECIHARLTESGNTVPLCRSIITDDDEYDAENLMLATIALNPVELMERPIVIYGEEACIGRPDPSIAVDWLKERI